MGGEGIWADGKGTECEEGKGKGGGIDKFNNERYIV